MEPNKCYPNISQSLLLLLLYIGLQLVIAVPVAILSLIFRFPEMHPVVLAVMNVSVMGILIAWGLRKTGAPFREVFPLKRVSWSLFLPIALTVMGMSIVVSEIGNLLQTVFSMPEWLKKFMEKALSEQNSVWGIVLVAVIIAPLTEEFLFRGLILRGYLKQYSVTRSIIVSAILFGVFHFNIFQFIGATMLGILFAWWTVQTRSLIPALFGHALNNALPIIYGRVLKLDIPGYTSGNLDQVEFHPAWFNAMGVVLAAVGVLILHQMFRTRAAVSVNALGWSGQTD
ncbi:MAG: CPBP family intramembrane glutamic endopeptidase [Acidobacteriota bacterium]|nr:CPBP family intramembrane metalloprotease [Blastocatellia bacterium]MDW8238090.1 CPBP family intramembrane glutamic endopeptidase [Acidobacteriota bacterium]